jgi:Glycosyltransferase (GlcNAc)
MVFVSIAAYRDLQLNATIKDYIRKVRNPVRLRFGICRQHAVDGLPFPVWI